jgi:hypothetical protein
MTEYGRQSESFPFLFDSIDPNRYRGDHLLFSSLPRFLAMKCS